MADRFQSTLRREFIGLGLTGAMVGLAGCSDSISIETGSDDSTDGGSDGNVNLDTASFSFSYDDDAQQVTIEFTGGADIRAGDLQIRQDGGKRVQWAELGSTTTGPDEVIDSGSTATLGPNILNWETAITAEDTIRLVYTGKETPATLERYSPPEDTDTTTTVPASISEFTLESRSEQRLHISFVADKQLETLEVGITGAESRTLQMADFTESQTGSGSYLYEATIPVDAEGSYTATLEDAVDISGNDSTSGKSPTATTNLTTETTDTTPPTIDAFSITNPSGQSLRISFDSSESLSSIRVDISGPESTTLTQSEFTQSRTESGTFTYEATYESDSEGTFTATLIEATDENNNDGSNNQSVTISIDRSNDEEGSRFSFEEASTGSAKPDGEWYVMMDEGEHEISAERSTHGEKSMFLRGSSGLGQSRIAIDLDFTSIDTITFDAYPTQNNTYAGDIKVHIDNTNNTVGGVTGSSTNEWHEISGDVSDFEGTHTLFLRTRGDENAAFFDNGRLLDSSGNLISPEEVIVGQSNDEEGSRFSFEEASTGSAKPDGEWYVMMDEGEHEISAERSTHGEQSMFLRGSSGLGQSRIAIDLDFTSIDTITFDAYPTQNNPSAGDIKIHVNNTDNTVGGVTGDSTNEWHEISGDVSDFEGTQTLILRTRGSGNAAFFDNGRLFDSDGNLISPDRVLGSQNGSLSLPFTETFQSGLNGWNVNQRHASSREGGQTGEGGYSDSYGGSVRLHVDGGPSVIGVGKETTGIPAGTELTATVQVEDASREPGGIHLAVFGSDSGDRAEERTNSHSNERISNGEFEINHTVQNEYSEGAEIRVYVVVWPGEFTTYVTSIQAQVSVE